MTFGMDIFHPNGFEVWPKWQWRLCSDLKFFYEKITQKLHFWRILVEPENSRCDFGQKKWSKQKVVGDFFGPKWVLEHIGSTFGAFAYDFGLGRNENMTSRFWKNGGKSLFLQFLEYCYQHWGGRNVAEMVLKSTMDLFGQSELAEMITGPNIVNLKNL